MSAPAQAIRSVTAQGRYSGAVSRFLAYVVDVAASSAVFAAALAAISYAATVVSGRDISWNRDNAVVAGLFIAWQFFYFGYSWATAGRTIGMGLLGVRVVRADGAVLEPRRAIVRALVFPLSFLFCGLGLVGIVVQRENRALHDYIAGTAVVYAWDAP